MWQPGNTLPLSVMTSNNINLFTRFSFYLLVGERVVDDLITLKLNKSSINSPRGGEWRIFQTILTGAQSLFVVLRSRGAAPALVRALLPLLEGDLQLTVGVRQPD